MLNWRLIWQEILGKARKSGYSPTKRFDKVDRRHIKASNGLVEFARAISLQVLEGQKYSLALAPRIRTNSIQPISAKLVDPDPLSFRELLGVWRKEKCQNEQHRHQ